MGYLGIGLVLLLGIAVVVYGWLADRVDTNRRRDALVSVPDRVIPGLADDAHVPNYRTEDELLHGPDAHARHSLSPEELAELLGRLGHFPSLPLGHASKDFANAHGARSGRGGGLDKLDQPNRGGLDQPNSGGLDQPEGDRFDQPNSGGLDHLEGGLCVLESPRILVTDADVTSIRELLDFLARAGRDRVPVVVVAPSMAADVLATLRVNNVQGNVPCAVVLTADATKRAQLASLVGASPVSLDDLRSGYLPASAIGGCDTWVSSLERLWVVNDPS